METNDVEKSMSESIHPWDKLEELRGILIQKSGNSSDGYKRVGYILRISDDIPMKLKSENTLRESPSVT